MLFVHVEQLKFWRLNLTGIPLLLLGTYWTMKEPSCQTDNESILVSFSPPWWLLEIDLHERAKSGCHKEMSKRDTSLLLSYKWVGKLAIGRFLKAASVESYSQVLDLFLISYSFIETVYLQFVYICFIHGLSLEHVSFQSDVGNLKEVVLMVMLKKVGILFPFLSGLTCI